MELYCKNHRLIEITTSRFLSLLVMTFFFLNSAVCFAGEVETLANSPEWLKLLHYQPQTFDGYKGLVENSDFYISDNGRFSPQDELKAEIQDFSGTRGKKCDFPARFEYLKAHNLVHGNLAECADYQQFMQDVQPNGISVLFTNAYMNNPASLFGHTLIRIDTKRKGTQMLAHGTNFGADSGSEYGFIFALKGLFGGYQGVYSISPYWNIINEYNNIENRDIWEYKLNLSEDEQLKFVNHLYEMRKARIRYYFLSKNCSYMVLELIEAVRPEIDLTSQYKNMWVIPLDTLKTILQEQNLVNETNYRPARLTKIKHSLQNMSAEQYKAFKRGVKDYDYNMPQLTAKEQAEVLETAYQYFQYNYIEKELELAEYRKNSFAVLRKRSQLPETKLQSDFAGENPAYSHDSMQISFGAGVYNKQSYEELTIRPAYTALTDSAYGLIKGAEVSVFKSVWRYYNRKHRAILQSFQPLNILSIVPADSIFSPISYSTNVEIKREFNPSNEKQGYVADLGLGIGKTYELLKNIRTYGLIEARGQYGGFMAHNYWLGIAPRAGVYADIKNMRIHLWARQTFATRKFGKRLEYNAEIAYGLSKNLSATLKYTAIHGLGKNQEDYSFNLRYCY